MRLAAKVAQPMSDKLGLDQLGDVSGIGAVTVLAVLVLIVVSFAAGIVARTDLGERVSRWFENSMLGGLPQYQLLKSMAEGLAQVQNSSSLEPALVSIEDGWQLGYLLETLENGWVAVFLPQAPTPMSGNVMYFPAERVRPLGITMIQAMALVSHRRRLRRGSAWRRLEATGTRRPADANSCAGPPVSVQLRPLVCPDTPSASFRRYRGRRALGTKGIYPSSSDVPVMPARARTPRGSEGLLGYLAPKP